MEKCRFRDALEAEERLIEQLIIGIRHAKIQEKLLSHDDILTLDAAMDITRICACGHERLPVRDHLDYPSSETASGGRQTEGR